MQTEERPPVRFAGLQMPVTQEIEKNKQVILDCLDWCKENKVNWLITPEGSLTGYFPKGRSDWNTVSRNRTSR